MDAGMNLKLLLTEEIGIGVLSIRIQKDTLNVIEKYFQRLL
jgi:hypothetical protein